MCVLRCLLTPLQRQPCCDFCLNIFKAARAAELNLEMKLLLLQLVSNNGAPIVQVGAVPVFIDADPITGNAKCEQLEEACCPGKTKAVMMAHALGNP